MQAAICLLSVVPMRKGPAHRSEMVSQLLFGETVTLGESKDDFVFVTSHIDGYQGWIQATQLSPIETDVKPVAASYTSGFVDTVIVNGQRITIPFGTPVYQYNENSIFSIDQYQLDYSQLQQGVWNSKEGNFSEDNLTVIVRTFLNTPYLWGGRSVFGIDCSGFVQQTFKLFGIPLLRDAYLQAEQGERVASLKEAQGGDLLFFENKTGRVVHVGMLQHDKRIVHAAGRVRIDQVTEEGIFNTETGKQTHVLHSIRRVF